MKKIKKTHPNKAYSLWLVNGYQQGFRTVANFGFGGQENASKPPQAICKPLGLIKTEQVEQKKKEGQDRQSRKTEGSK